MIGIIDYGMGNLQSVKNSCEYLKEKVEFVHQPEEMEKFSHLILPGVGSFAKGMACLEERGLAKEIRKQAVEKKKPLLGICLGMQLLADLGTEDGRTQGLGLIPGTVKRFELTGLRVPHVGWNNIEIRKANPVVTEDMAADYYFVHSYYFDADEKSDVLAACDYGIDFPCIVGRGKIFGVQFHPEKSHQYGLRILKNFAGLAC